MWIKFGLIVKTYTSLTCRRWSVTAACVLCLVILSIVVTLSVPLRSLTGTEAFVTSSALRNEPKSPYSETVRSKRVNNLNNIDKEYGNEKKWNDPRTTLETIFNKADTDGDGFLSVQELANWINNKVQEHITQALQENFGLFTAIDIQPRNGVVSWSEYHAHFLKQRGFSHEYIHKHKSHRTLTRSMKEAIMRDRASWSEAARSDPDHLTLDEFLAFRHPESSHAAVLALVDELLDKLEHDPVSVTILLLLPLRGGHEARPVTAHRVAAAGQGVGGPGTDRDGDEVLTEEEFSSLQAEGDGEKEGETLMQGKEERRKEFKEVIDRDKNGKADRTELLSAWGRSARARLCPQRYMDPKNPRHAREEARSLLALADTDSDARLSLPEILSKTDLFLASKMVDTARSFHDEF
ncbi:45 kDa calcium-binding protein isoform X2 [Bacillus rossius redtenbacheri]|uniref:45 kDa calcium-binding protein isoform X2 n=1 Tax=Bacillus rossius redtenbacheri TaxID=93214 RepID=UPI002FDCF67D